MQNTSQYSFPEDPETQYNKEDSCYISKEAKKHLKRIYKQAGTVYFLLLMLSFYFENNIYPFLKQFMHFDFNSSANIYIYCFYIYFLERIIYLNSSLYLFKGLFALYALLNYVFLFSFGSSIMIKNQMAFYIAVLLSLLVYSGIFFLSVYLRRSFPSTLVICFSLFSVLFLAVYQRTLLNVFRGKYIVAITIVLILCISANIVLVSFYNVQKIIKKTHENKNNIFLDFLEVLMDAVSLFMVSFLAIIFNKY